MVQSKSALLSLRMTPEAKALLALCAAREHRSMASMVEHMVHVYSESQGLTVPPTASTNNKNHPRKPK